MKIQGRQQYLWRAVDEDGDVLDILGAVATQPAGGRSVLPQIVDAAGAACPNNS